MSEQFTGKAISRGVSLPIDMWQALEKRSKRTLVPVSAFIRDIVEKVLLNEQQPHQLTDTRTDYRSN